MKTKIILSIAIAAITLNVGAKIIDRVETSQHKQYSTYQLLKANDCLDTQGNLTSASDMCLMIAFPEKGAF